MPYEQAKRAKDFIENFGVNIHLRYNSTAYWTFANVKSRMLELGVKWFRDDVAESWSKPTVMPLFRELGAAGFKMLLISNHTQGNTPLKTRDDVIALGGVVKAVEGPNEWNNNGTTYNTVQFPAGLVSYASELYDALKNTTSTKDVIVLYPSLYEGGQVASLIPFWIPSDYGNLHCYPGGQVGSEPRIDGYYKNWATSTTGSKAWWATETGYDTAINDTSNSYNYPLSEEALNRYTPRLLFEYFNRGIKAFIYELYDLGTDLSKKGDCFGLIKSDNTPKDVFNTIKNIMGLLADTTDAPFWPRWLDVSVTAPTTIKKTLLQRNNGRFYLCLWYEDHSYNAVAKTIAALNYRSVTLSFGQSFSTINVYRPWVDTTVFQTASATATIAIQVPDHVVIVELIP